jgi:hypothetical protein
VHAVVLTPGAEIALEEHPEPVAGEGKVLMGVGAAGICGTDLHAPVELAGVASGLQSTAMQLGGSLGTAILGAVMSAKISSLLPASWTAARLPPSTRPSSPG